MAYENFIPETLYTTWVANWEAQEKTSNPFPFFTDPDTGSVQTGARFDLRDISLLLSTVGITTLKIRFGLQHVTANDWQFHLLLFGANSKGEIITPYLTAPVVMERQLTIMTPTDGPGNLPQVLMQQWRQGWFAEASDGSIDVAMFKTKDDLLLRGYNYPASEVMKALGMFDGSETMYIAFGLHKYLSMYETAVEAPTAIQTFGLILYAIFKENFSLTLDKKLLVDVTLVEDSGYYDLSAPCPFTC